MKSKNLESFLNARKEKEMPQPWPERMWLGEDRNAVSLDFSGLH
jgi:hypothetical protein